MSTGYRSCACYWLGACRSTPFEFETSCKVTAPSFVGCVVSTRKFQQLQEGLDR